MNDAVRLLEDEGGYTEKEIAEKFLIEETEKEWIIRALGHLDGVTLHKLIDTFGRYQPDPKTKNAIFYLPKDTHSNESAGSNPKQENTASILDEGEYALSKSLKGKLGQLVPCLEDAEGIVFDGFHRRKINEKAWTVKLDQVKTPMDRALARMTVNFCRRHYTSEEMKNDIGLLIGGGYSVEQIAEITGISERTIYRYKPEESKDQKMVELGKMSKTPLTAVSESEVARQDKFVPTPAFEEGQKTYMAELVECSQCHLRFHKSRIVEGLCPQCAAKAGKAKPQPPEQPKPNLSKVKDTWEYRKAAMQTSPSKPEMDLRVELANRGITPKTDEWVCLWGTKPDGTYPEKKIAYYVHGEPHDKGKALNRDDEIRAALEKDGWTVFVFRHDEGNVKEWADTLEEALKW
jgi:G:T-mismatch repair DNA endonuclease (very short patch repair protein)